MQAFICDSKKCIVESSARGNCSVRTGYPHSAERKPRPGLGAEGSQCGHPWVISPSNLWDLFIFRPCWPGYISDVSLSWEKAGTEKDHWLPNGWTRAAAILASLFLVIFIDCGKKTQHKCCHLSHCKECH